ncbi:OmpP1/FadL family transporter [Sphingobacterium bovistauri]|uniref:Outer membrane protein transport protein n=1 Tax=Sphingobacterium bovistauri TaxID=2781959 RepID=A0ABS7Z174_9SPHI|nr:outer membrane protein transport protein [Sphingobacterium bovistauri]MCA5003920.1 outer membrane protein transport protein [Sphingobacterium bovistauri]
MKKILFALLLASPTLTFAQGSQVNTQGIRALGMSGAGSALFVDETSIFYSPGALAKATENSISIGASAVMYRSAFKEVNSNVQHDTEFQISPPFSVFASFGPKNSWWKAGIGVYTPFGGGVNWGTEWPGRFELNHLSMRAIYIQPTLSFKITENFGIGGGFVYNIGSVDLSRSIPVFDQNGNPGRAELNGIGTGMGYNVGIHYNLEDDFAISLSYRSHVRTKLEDGDAVFTVPTALSTSFPNTKFSAELPLPSSFNLGIAFPLGDKVDLAADATFIGYSIYEKLVFDYEQNTPVLSDTEQIKDYENALSAKVGLNIHANEKLDLRFGTGYVYTPVRSKYVYAETPDNNRVMGSIGFTYNISDKFDFSGAYTLQRIIERTTTNIATGMSGTYKTNIHAPGISLTYKW